MSESYKLKLHNICSYQTMINVHNFCKLLPLAEFFIRKMKTRKFELMLMRGVKVYSVLTVHGLWISFLLEIELTLKKFMIKGSMGVCLRFILEIHSILHYALLSNFFTILNTYPGLP